MFDVGARCSVKGGEKTMFNFESWLQLIDLMMLSREGFRILNQKRNCLAVCVCHMVIEQTSSPDPIAFIIISRYAKDSLRVL